MQVSDTGTIVEAVAAVAVIVGLVGIVVPVIPGLFLCWGGVAFWALFGDAGWGRWVVLGVATALVVAGTVIKYLVPGRNLKKAGVPTLSLLVGGVLGVIGFFLVPVVGLVIGFILGVWLAEQVRLHDWRASWESTKHALKATGVSMLIELTAGVGILVVFAVGAARA